jgi:hypothetical protein
VTARVTRASVKHLDVCQIVCEYVRLSGAMGHNCMYIINFIGTKRLLIIRNITAYSAQKGVEELSTWQEGQLGTA